MARQPKVIIKTALAYSRGWPETRFVAVVDGVELSAKNGAARKFTSPEAASRAADKHIKAAISATHV